MPPRRRKQLSPAEAIFGIIAVVFMGVVMIATLPGGGAKAIGALVALVLGIIGFVGVLIVLVFVCRKFGFLNKPQGASPTIAAPVAVAKYQKQPTLLSPAERSFFGVLQQTVSADYVVFAKIRLADIVRPASNLSRSAWFTAFNPTTGKHVDFVLCDRASVNVLAAIELDDSSHESFERGFRDYLVDSALKDAGIPMLRVQVQQSYSPAQLRQQIEALLPQRENRRTTPLHSKQFVAAEVTRL
jgi:hypothetical protein